MTSQCFQQQHHHFVDEQLSQKIVKINRQKDRQKNITPHLETDKDIRQHNDTQMNRKIDMSWDRAVAPNQSFWDDLNILQVVRLG